MFLNYLIAKLTKLQPIAPRHLIKGSYHMGRFSVPNGQIKSYPLSVFILG